MPDPLSDPLARELARLAPAPSRVTGAAVLFAAGQQAAEIKANRWRLATGLMALVFVGSWVGMTLRTESPTRTAGPQEMVVQAVVTPARPTPPSPSPESEPPLPRPIPQLVATDRPSEETLERRAKGIRLMHDILAGGLGMIPDSNPGETRRVPNASSMELNPAVLGGYYQSPKKDD
jgi:hypothetical protein